MEEMNKEIMENGVMEIVEEATSKLTFKENLAAYSIAGIFGIGVVTTGYLAVKGGQKLYKAFKSKRNKVEESDETVVDIEENDIQDANNETEQE